MLDKSLSQISRELASNWVYKVHAWRGRSPEFMQAQVSRLEAVIREAMQKALEAAAEVVLDNANASLHEGAAPSRECQICKWLVISAEAIRSLKPAKQGMEAVK